MSHPDVIVVGGGIVGAACAAEIAAHGREVLLLEAGTGTGGGATAAGMGHILTLDDTEAQFRLTRWSQQLWDGMADELPAAVQRERCGSIWVAADGEELALVEDKVAFYGRRGVAAERIDARQLAELEPELREGLAGGLLMEEDSVLYPPAWVDWILGRSARIRVECGVRVARTLGKGVELDDGTTRPAGAVVNAAGDRALELLPEPLPELEIRPRKGHLAITARAPGFCRHQLVELGYIKSAHGDARSSVAFNVQPRITGQVLIGSSRQYGAADGRVELDVLARMLRRAAEYLPGLPSLPVIRTWTGFRAATADKLPIIGPAPGVDGLYLATGHEGLGITTSLATARIVAAQLDGREPEIDPRPYRPDRSLPEAA